MFIIWGWTGKPETLAQGRFFCPACQSETEYDHQQMRTFFTIFFIPLIPLAAGQRYVECRQCKGTFVEAILDMPAIAADASSQPGERILGKRGEYWYPGTYRNKANKKIMVDFDDGKQVLLSKSQVIPLDLRDGDPVYVRRQEGAEYQFGNIVALGEANVQVRFEDGRCEWTKMANIRVIWEEEEDKDEEDD